MRTEEEYVALKLELAKSNERLAEVEGANHLNKNALRWCQEELTAAHSGVPEDVAPDGFFIQKMAIKYCEQYSIKLGTKRSADVINAFSVGASIQKNGQQGPVKMRLTSGDDGLFAHFQINDGYQCGVNLDHIELCKRFCDEYRALLNSTPAIPAPETSQWQPISTAPMHTAVLVAGYDYGDESHERHYTVARLCSEGWVEANGEALTWLTHWMPLPAPPQSAENGEGL